MRVLSVAFPFAPVSPTTAGGAEQILHALDEALVSAGHTSLVIACGGSEIAGRLFPIPSPRTQIVDESEKARCRTLVQGVIDHVFATQPVDLVHMHGLDFAEYRLPHHVPTLVTLHMPVSWYRPDAWRRFGAHTHYCCVSETQRGTVPRELRHCSVVINGVRIPPLPTGASQRDYALVMGRICPEKNAAAALQAATRAGIPVQVIGQTFPYREHLDYLHKQIEPLLQPAAGGVQHSIVGVLPPEHRHTLLGHAKCLLHPTLAPETSSLVAMEALAAGIPVIAYPSGALPEIVEHGVTGFLVESVDSMADALHRVDGLSRQACHRSAERRFNRTRMVGEYFTLYDSLLRHRAYERRYA